MEKFGKRTRSSNNEITCPFQTVMKREEVDIQWVKSVVSVGLPTTKFIPNLDHLIDDKNMGKMREMTTHERELVQKDVRFLGFESFL